MKEFMIFIKSEAIRNIELDVNFNKDKVSEEYRIINPYSQVYVDNIKMNKEIWEDEVKFREIMKNKIEEIANNYDANPFVFEFMDLDIPFVFHCYSILE